MPYKTINGKKVFIVPNHPKHLPPKQARRKFPDGFISLGKISACPECGFKGYGKQGQKRNGDFLKPKKPFCNNCGLNKPDYILR